MRISIESDETTKATTIWERMKCCGRNKVGDQSAGGCFQIGKRKDSWAERRDSIFNNPNNSNKRCEFLIPKILALKIIMIFLTENDVRTNVAAIYSRRYSACICAARRKLKKMQLVDVHR